MSFLRKRSCRIVFLTGLLASVNVSGQTLGFLPLDQIMPGMIGTCKTTLKEVLIEEFQVEILGVMEKIRPARNLILCRFLGSEFKETGVFSGMSGSPVYIGGKLIGAVAFSFPFSKEPIAGITPIHEMVEIFNKGSTRSQWSVPRSFSDRSNNLGTQQKMSTLLPQTPVAFSQLGIRGHLEPILTPLSLSGFDPVTIRFFEKDVRSLGFLPALGFLSSSDDFWNASVVPGATLVAQLIRGDLQVGAAGTITHVSGKRVYAFGHPFLGAGFTDIPMALGAVLTVISSLSTGFKVTTVGDLVGSIKQDRDTGVLGFLGERARMLPVSIRLKTSRQNVREINVELVRGPFLTPLLANLVVFNSLLSSERSRGPQAIRIAIQISVNGQPDVRYSRNSDTITEAALTVGGVLDLLMNSGFSDVPVEKVQVDIQAVEEQKATKLEQVWVDKQKVKPGEKVKLKLVLRRENGKMLMQNYSFKVPRDLEDGPLEVLVGEGISFTRTLAAKNQAQIVPQTVDQLVRAINDLKKNDRIYVRLFRKEPGAVVAGEGMPLLPPSMLEIYRSERTSGASHPLEYVIYLETELDETDLVLEGAKTIHLVVKG